MAAAVHSSGSPGSGSPGSGGPGSGGFGFGDGGFGGGGGGGCGGPAESVRAAAKSENGSSQLCGSNSTNGACVWHRAEET